jgi:hypothetical protein
MEYLLHGFPHCRMIASFNNRFASLAAVFMAMAFHAVAQPIGETA